MKSKPLIMDHIRINHKSFTIDFTFTNNITILTGAAGTGKTMVFSFIRECESNNSQFLCLNYENVQDDMLDVMSRTEGKMIVIDNADILLTDDVRKYISLDAQNQYLIIGRNPKNLFATSDNLYELENTTVNGQAVISLKPFL